MMFIIYLNFFNYQRTKYYEILHVFNRINHQGQTFKPLKKVVNVVKYENNCETKNTKSKN